MEKISDNWKEAIQESVLEVTGWYLKETGKKELAQMIIKKAEEIINKPTHNNITQKVRKWCRDNNYELPAGVFVAINTATADIVVFPEVTSKMRNYVYDLCLRSHGSDCYTMELVLEELRIWLQRGKI